MEETTTLPVEEKTPKKEPTYQEMKKQRDNYHAFLRDEIKQLELETKFYELKLLKIDYEEQIKKMMPDDKSENKS